MTTSQDTSDFERYIVPDKYMRTLEEATSDFPDEYIVGHEAEALDWLDARGKEIAPSLPELKEKLDVHAAHAGAAVLVVTIEIDPKIVPPTPTTYNFPDKATVRSYDLHRGLLLGMANWYGYGYNSQQNGVILNDIVPLDEKRETEHHSASQLVLGLHTEDASYNYAGIFTNALTDVDMSPDVLTLQYLRNEDKTPTTVSVLDVTKLSSSARDELTKDQYFNRTNPAQGGRENDSDQAASLLYGTDGTWVRLNSALTHPHQYSGKARDAFSELLQHLEAGYSELPLIRGDIAFIDNRRALHGRAAYKPHQLPKYDGTDRWQKRLVAGTDRDRIKSFEASNRVVDPKKLLAALAIARSQ